MNLKTLLISIGLVLISIIACKTKQSIETEDFRITYEMSSGRSKAKPVYSIHLHKRRVEYNGLKNMQVLGKHSYDISKETFNNLKTNFRESNFSSFQTEYKGRIRDLPTSIISYQGHTIKFQEKEAPVKLMQLVTLVKNLIPENS